MVSLFTVARDCLVSTSSAGDSPSLRNVSVPDASESALARRRRPRGKMDGKGWIKPSFHPLALGPPTTFRRFAAKQPPAKVLLPNAQDESHAFLNHTSPRARSPSRRTRPSASTAQLDLRRHSSAMSTAGASGLSFQPSASAPALNSIPGRRPAPGHQTRVALRPQASTSRPRSPRPAKQPEALDPSRSSTIGPNLAYTNYMALSTPLVRRWVRTPREPAHVPPAKPGYYAAHEIWPLSHHAPGVQHHLRPLRVTSPESHRSRTGPTAQASGVLVWT